MDRTPSSGYFRSKLQNAKAAEDSKQQTTRTKKQARDDHIFDSSDDDTDQNYSNQARHYPTPPSAPSAWRGISRVPDATPSRKSSFGSTGAPRSVGLRETDDHVNKLLKANFDLKMEVFHLREWKRKFQEKDEGVQNLAEEVKKLRAENQRLSEELEDRDQAVDEAISMICDLEMKVKILEEQTRLYITSGGAHDVDEQRSAHLQTVKPDALDEFSRGQNHATAHTGSIPLRSSRDDPSRSTTTLRSMYSEGGKAIRPVPSSATLQSSRPSATEYHDDEDRSPATPDFSEIRESELGSLYAASNAHEEQMSEYGDGEPAANLHVPDEHRAEKVFAKVDRWVNDVPVDTRSIIVTTSSRSASQSQGAPLRPPPLVGEDSVRRSRPETSMRTNSSNERLSTGRSHSQAPSMPRLHPNTTSSHAQASRAYNEEAGVVTAKPKKVLRPKPDAVWEHTPQVDQRSQEVVRETAPSRSSQRPRPSRKEERQHAVPSSGIQTHSDGRDNHGYHQDVMQHPRVNPRSQHTSESTVVRSYNHPPTQRRETNDGSLVLRSEAQTPPYTPSDWGIEVVGFRGNSSPPTERSSVVDNHQHRQLDPGYGAQLSHVPHTNPVNLTNSQNMQAPHEDDRASHPDSNLRRHASLRDRFKVGFRRRGSMSDRANAVDQSSKPPTRRNSVTRLFSFASKNGQDTNASATAYENTLGNSTANMNIGLPQPNRPLHFHESSFTTPRPAPTPISRSNSLADSRSHSSSRLTDLSEHSNPMMTTHRSTASSSSSGPGITVTTVRVPFATTVDTKKRKPLSRKLSLKGPAIIETSGDGRVIGFPRRGEGGKVASVVGLHSRAYT